MCKKTNKGIDICIPITFWNLRGHPSEQIAIISGLYYWQNNIFYHSTAFLLENAAADGEVNCDAKYAPKLIEIGEGDSMKLIISKDISSGKVIYDTNNYDFIIDLSYGEWNLVYKIDEVVDCQFYQKVIKTKIYEIDLDKIKFPPTMENFDEECPIDKKLSEVICLGFLKRIGTECKLI